MDGSSGRPWWYVLIAALVVALVRQFGWRGLVLAMGVAAAADLALSVVRDFGFRWWQWLALALALVALTGLLVSVGHRMRTVVQMGQPIPPYFGISYVDQSANVCVCHTIPINLLVGVLQAMKLRMKKGLGVKIGR
jgi:hypothetical protein